MKNSIQIALLFALLITLSFSCTKDSTGSCSSDIICYTDKPDMLYVRLDLTNSPGGKPVKVTFYIGDIDKGEVFDSFLTTSAMEMYQMPVNEKYSATAKYVVNGDTILVVDGDQLTRKYCTDDNTNCYDWDYEMGLDLRLK